MAVMDRRGFIRAAGIALAAGSLAASDSPARMFDSDVDPKLFEKINRVEDPENMTGLELHHVPIPTVQGKVTGGKPFMVEVAVGSELHAVSPSHRITDITLLAGNEPVGTVSFSSTMAQPKAAFLVSLDKPVTLVAQARCNLHGLWEGILDVNIG